MKKQAFTLVELIVVVTILAILATIGFVSYSGYLTGVRDTNRIASLTSISDGLELYRTKNDLPNPDDGINIQIEGTTIANQGYAGANVLQTIEYSKAGKDPKDNSYYSYYLTDDKKHYQLMAFLEETENLESYSLVGKTNATVNYSNRHPKVYGKNLGILTDANNTPVQETTTSSLNFTGGTTTDYIARFTDNSQISGNGGHLKALQNSLKLGGNYKSCKEILEKNQNLQRKDDNYFLSVGGNNFEAFCDMTTQGGGWTYVLAGTNNKYKIGKDNYMKFIKSTYIQNQTEFMWKINKISDNSLVSIVKIKFDNTYDHWMNNHTGDNPNLNARWYVEIPSMSILYDYSVTGIVRAVQYAEKIEAYTGYGIHYKREGTGEHRPWFSIDSNYSGGSYLCGSIAGCGYQGVDITNAQHVIGVR